MKKEKRSESRHSPNTSGNGSHDRGQNAEHSQDSSSSTVDQEVETILDPSWAWRMLHKR